MNGILAQLLAVAIYLLATSNRREIAHQPDE